MKRPIGYGAIWLAGLAIGVALGIYRNASRTGGAPVPVTAGARTAEGVGSSAALSDSASPPAASSFGPGSSAEANRSPSPTEGEPPPEGAAPSPPEATPRMRTVRPLDLPPGSDDEGPVGAARVAEAAPTDKPEASRLFEGALAPLGETGSADAARFSPDRTGAGTTTMVSEPASSPIVAKPIRQGDAFPAGALRTELDPEFAKRAGQRIWQSECEGTKLGLTSWNEGEDFASLGIGHFLWFPKDKEFEFEESFPEFLDYYRSLPASEPMPDWLTMAVDCPWANRDEFLGARDDKRMIELREFLFATVPEQTRFVYRRLLASRSKILELASPEKRNHLDDRFAALSRTTEGQYAMMDYVNFKGEGTNPKERYEGQGWGLFQVLETMNPALRERDAVVDFSRAAEAMLRRRVENHPEDARWIEGWSHRTRAYSQPFEALP